MKDESEGFFVGALTELASGSPTVGIPILGTSAFSQIIILGPLILDTIQITFNKM